MKRCLALGLLGFVLAAFVTLNPLAAAQPPGQSPAPERCTPYVLDRDAFGKELLAAKDAQERLAILARRWDQVLRAVAHCDVAMQPVSFHRSLAYWQSGYTGRDAEKVVAEQNLEQPVVAEKEAAVFVHGDCLADITVKGHGLIHIYGDLGAKITTVGDVQVEIVIGGDLKQNAGIDGEGIVRMFVGGSVDGYIRNRGSSDTWITGDLSGEIKTGVPSTAVHVMGDFKGAMKPLDKGALAYLDVRGFMPSAKIKAIADCGYTQFQATVGFSDQAPGLYPKRRGPPERLWVIHAQRPPTRDEP